METYHIEKSQKLMILEKKLILRSQ